MTRAAPEFDSAQLSLPLFSLEEAAALGPLTRPAPGIKPSIKPEPDAPGASLDGATPEHAARIPPAPPAPHAPPARTPDSPTALNPRSRREVLLEGHVIPYQFKRARRRTIGFLVGPEGLSVSAPRWVGLVEVDAALREKGRWILRKLADQRERQARLESARIEWRDGTSVPFLGEPVIVLLDPRASGSVLNAQADALPGIPRLTLHVGLPQSAEPHQIRDAVQSWLQRQARRVFEERCQHFAPRLGVRYMKLGLSSAQTRWGSASADGAIRLNWRLIHFALPTIDYVVTHELAHLREMNHSPRFWDVVRSVMPDYEAARGQLRDELLPVFE